MALRTASETNGEFIVRLAIMGAEALPGKDDDGDDNDEDGVVGTVGANGIARGK